MNPAAECGHAAPREAVRIAAVVMLYNPDLSSLAETINSYADQVELVLAIDNSEVPSPATAAILAGMPRVHYLPNGDNLGVGYTLNRAVTEAQRLGCTHLLTLDQDSRATAGMVVELLRRGGESGFSDIALLAARPVGPGERSSTTLTPWEEVAVAITSGSLLDLAACRTIGPFREDLFIDYVDFDYCLRLRVGGFRIVRVNTAELEHQLGKVEYHRLCGRTFTTTNHSPLRRYYMTRNRFALVALYGSRFPRFKREQMRSFRYELATMLLFETERLAKVHMIWRGYRDYRRGKLGRLDKNG